MHKPNTWQIKAASSAALLDLDTLRRAGWDVSSAMRTLQVEGLRRGYFSKAKGGDQHSCGGCGFAVCSCKGAG